MARKVSRRAEGLARAFMAEVQADLEAKREADRLRDEADKREARRAAARERYRLSKIQPLPAVETRRLADPSRLPGPPNPLPPGPVIRVDIRDWARWKEEHGLVTHHYDRRNDLWYVTDKPSIPIPGDDDEPYLADVE